MAFKGIVFNQNKIQTEGKATVIAAGWVDVLECRKDDLKKSFGKTSLLGGWWFVVNRLIIHLS